ELALVQERLGPLDAVADGGRRRPGPLQKLLRRGVAWIAGQDGARVLLGRAVILGGEGAQRFLHQIRDRRFGCDDRRRRRDSGWGGTSRILYIVAANDSPTNARCPEKSSYRTTAVEKMSARWSTRSPRTCSGDM